MYNSSKPYFSDIMHGASIWIAISLIISNRIIRRVNRRRKQLKNGFPRFSLYFREASMVVLLLPAIHSITLQIHVRTHFPYFFYPIVHMYVKSSVVIKYLTSNSFSFIYADTDVKTILCYTILNRKWDAYFFNSII